MKRRAIRALTALIAVATSLLGGELLARARGWGLPAPSPPSELRGKVVTAPVSAPTLVVLGDSIPWGYGLEDPRAAWPVQVGLGLAKRGTPWQVVDVSLPGETSLQGWARWRRDVLPRQPQIVLIAFGLNDGHLQWTPADARRWQRFPRGWGYRVRLVHVLYTGLRRPLLPPDFPRPLPVRPRMEPEHTALVIRTLVREMKRAGIIPYILTPSPVTLEFHPEWPLALREYQRDVYRQVCGVLLSVGEEERVPVIDVYKAMWPPHPPWYQEDGIHLSPAGHKRVATVVLESLSTY